VLEKVVRMCLEREPKMRGSFAELKEVMGTMGMGMGMDMGEGVCENPEEREVSCELPEDRIR
jgi:hypothetical protein